MRHTKTRGRDPDTTRCSALDAAQRLFAEKGFAGSSMREIAAVSGVSQPLIYYHFGSKEGLYSAVKERLMKEGLRAILPGGSDSLETAPGAIELIRTTYNFVSGNEDLMRLVAWAHLERENTPWPGEAEFTLAAANHIQRRLSDSVLRKSVDPLIATIMIEALIFFWSANRRYYASIFDEPLEKITERYLDQIADLFFRDTPARKDKE
ncbi:MAG: TetR/AcrR family transcriptional regulator [Syntrophobacter sp.]